MTTPSAGAMRAAALCDSQCAAYEQREMQGDRTPRAKRLQELASIIDRETNHAALVEAAKKSYEQFEYMLSQMGNGGDKEPYVNASSEVTSRMEELRAALSQEGS